MKAWRDYPYPAGAVIGNRYRIEMLLGEGSYGLTYRCRDTRDGAVLALKQSRPSKGEAGRRMLGRESSILQAMDHPNIPGSRDYFRYKGENWLASDYIAGKTLEDLIFDEQVVYGERECLAVTLRLMELVKHVHARGYVHLDLRIPNVILREEELYLIDFGLAREIGETDILPPDPERNRAWKWKWPPKPKEEEPPSPPLPEIASDLYDAGQLMLFMLYSGFKPERGAAERHWREELSLSPGMLQLLEKLLGEQGTLVYTDTGDFVREAEELYKCLM
ncbi:protein kinase domain-containing protein [Paenibacillus sp. MMS20-IR301]|uniref:serine/threonine protein kinase n=1 Tax=Paenibacillus sp. MMS20-IR301 TaxID=2895946 RepID=UPI0028EA8B89|nr:protein kinase [Paenibacillus sp. MMS20-IR301]WNS44032.1 protein kinase [Paenibacillus sp. MMS20-IR301]